MKVGHITQQTAAQRVVGFSIIEVLVASAVVGILFVALYASFTYGFAVVQLARENLRATQILQEKMETIRLYNWDQITTPGFIPSSFSAPFYSTNVSSVVGTNSGFSYQGTVMITNSPISASYSNDLRLVRIRVTWASGNVPRHREMDTFVARYGLQNYVY